MSDAAALSPRPPPPNPAATVHSLLVSLSDPSALRLLPAPLLAFSQLRRLLPPAAGTQILLRPIASLLQLHLSDLRIGLQLHGLSLSLGLSCYSHLLPRLLSFYSHHPSLLPTASSLAAGSTSPEPYNVLMSACLGHGLPRHALAAYQEMIDRDAVAPDAFTYPKVLRACAETANLALGRAVHVRAADAGMDGHLFCQNALVSMYAKCGDLAAARTVFDGMDQRDVVSWNSMISGLAASGQWREAVELFHRMQAEGAEVNSVTLNTIADGYIQMRDYRAAVGLIRDMVRGGASVDSVTLVIGSNACSRAGWLRLGKEIHGLAVRIQCHEIDSVIIAVITMYARCNDMERALMLFRTIRCPGLAAWNTIIAGFALSDDAEAASRLFREMVCSDVQPNYVTVVTYLALCARVANLQHGRELHTHIIKKGFKGYRMLWNSLIDMYSKSGRLSVAQNVFDTMDDRDMISFTSMIAGYGMQGKGILSLRIFKQMIDSGIMPDAISMVTVLSACSHSKLVDEGEELFDKMMRSYGIKPQMKHYSCMVDLYARAGLLEKAEELLNQIPFPPTSTMVAALVRACQEQGDIIIGERSARRLLGMKTENDGHYVLIANMYAASGKEPRSQLKKRTKKLAPRPGRKKSMAGPTPTGANTPRTRAPLAREAAARAAKEAEEAAAKAYAAAERDVLDVVPIEVEAPPPATPTRAKRNICLDLQVVGDLDEGTPVSVEAPPKKFTPRPGRLQSRRRVQPRRRGTNETSNKNTIPQNGFFCET